MTSQFLDASDGLAPVAQCLSRAGVMAVGRYYNYGAGRKVLTRQEAQTLIANNIALWVVFQYYGNEPKWFNAELGRKDAVRALECAHEIVGQPEGSAIYFGVDYREDGHNYTNLIATYFTAVRDVFRRQDGSMPYRIGVYGDGLVCRRLLDDGLVTETWLSCSSSYPEHAAFYASRRWSLSQTCGVPRICGVDVDSDEVNSGCADFGQFDHLAPLVPSHSAGAAAQMLPEFIANANAADAVEDDPAKPHVGDESETADYDTARLLTNLGLAVGPSLSARVRRADLAARAATTLDLDIASAQKFLEACVNARPRVTYGMGAKVPFLGATPGIDFQKIDCSGFVREAICRAERTHVGFPDGSVVQHDWVRAHRFAKVDTRSCKAMDGLVRIAFLRPQDTQSRIGHVVLIYNGRTLESHGGIGPDSLPWIGAGWQALAYAYVLTGLPEERGSPASGRLRRQRAPAPE